MPKKPHSCGLPGEAMRELDDIQVDFPVVKWQLPARLRGTRSGPSAPRRTWPRSGGVDKIAPVILSQEMTPPAIET